MTSSRRRCENRILRKSFVKLLLKENEDQKASKGTMKTKVEKSEEKTFVFQEKNPWSKTYKKDTSGKPAVKTIYPMRPPGRWAQKPLHALCVCFCVSASLTRMRTLIGQRPLLGKNWKVPNFFQDNFANVQFF